MARRRARPPGPGRPLRSTSRSAARATISSGSGTEPVSRSSSRSRRSAVGHLGEMPVEQQEQGGDHGAAFQHPQVGGARRARPGQHQPAEHLGAGGPPAPTIDSARSARRRASGTCRSTVPPSTFGQLGGHLGHAAAAQHQFGEPVVGQDGEFDVPALLAQRRVRVLQSDQRLPGFGEQPGVVQGDRGVGGERGQQGDLIAGEGPLVAVGGEQHADHLGTAFERDAEDRHQTLGVHGGVDGRRCAGTVRRGSSRRRRSGRPAARPGRRGPAPSGSRTA